MQCIFGPLLLFTVTSGHFLKCLVQLVDEDTISALVPWGPGSLGWFSVQTTCSWCWRSCNCEFNDGENTQNRTRVIISGALYIVCSDPNRRYWRISHYSKYFKWSMLSEEFASLVLYSLTVTRVSWLVAQWSISGVFLYPLQSVWGVWVKDATVTSH